MVDPQAFSALMKAALADFVLSTIPERYPLSAVEVFDCRELSGDVTQIKYELWGKPTSYEFPGSFNELVRHLLFGTGPVF